MGNVQKEMPPDIYSSTHVVSMHIQPALKCLMRLVKHIGMSQKCTWLTGADAAGAQAPRSYSNMSAVNHVRYTHVTH